MRYNRGFTVVELIVVMVIMAILLTLATFSVTHLRANARDSQRNANVGNIARGLETRFKEGNNVINGQQSANPGSYPSISEIRHIIGNNIAIFTPSQVTGGYSNEVLPGTSIKDFSPPDLTGDYAGFTIALCPSDICPTVLDSAELGSSSGQAVTKDQFYYEPIDADGKVCNVDRCVRFNLYWRTEVDNSTHIIRSKNQ